MVEGHDQIGLLSLKGQRLLAVPAPSVDQLNDADHPAVMIQQGEGKHRATAVAEIEVETRVEGIRNITRDFIQIVDKNRLAGESRESCYRRLVDRYYDLRRFQRYNVVLGIRCFKATGPAASTHQEDRAGFRTGQLATLQQHPAKEFLDRLGSRDLDKLQELSKNVHQLSSPTGSPGST